MMADPLPRYIEHLLSPIDWACLLPGDKAHIAYCGLCREYANGRKRARAKALGPPLPGFDSGQYQLHKPCSQKGLTWLRKLTYRLEKAGFLLRKRERIPDRRQARGWDLGTRLYLKESNPF